MKAGNDVGARFLVFAANTRRFLSHASQGRFMFADAV
jgi:hypothetical protein